MLDYKDFKTVRKTRQLRDTNIGHIIPISNGGWHFSYIGGIDKVIKKIESLAHPELNTNYFKEENRIKQILEQGLDLFDRNNKYEFVSVDETFPLYLRSNLHRFEHLLKGK